MEMTDAQWEIVQRILEERSPFFAGKWGDGVESGRPSDEITLYFRNRKFLQATWNQARNSSTASLTGPGASRSARCPAPGMIHTLVSPRMPLAKRWA